MRYARHGDKDPSILLKPHARRRASFVGNDGAGIRDFRLLQVAFDHRALKPFKDMFHIGEGSFINDQVVPTTLPWDGNFLDDAIVPISKGEGRKRY